MNNSNNTQRIVNNRGPIIQLPPPKHRSEADVILLDFSKDFDPVLRQRLLFEIFMVFGTEH